jgi:hypothetical protein
MTYVNRCRQPKYSAARISDFFRDEFLPALQSAVTIALLIIKYDFDADWFKAVVDVLLSAFDEAHRLQRLKFGYVSQMPDALRYWRPGFEIFVAMKCIAIFAVMRDKPRFFPSVLRPVAVPVDIDEPSRPARNFMYKANGPNGQPLRPLPGPDLKFLPSESRVW